MSERQSAKAIRQALDSSTYYAILNVAKDASVEALQDAFHHFALEYHPDRYVREPREFAALAAEIFKRGAEAFAVLSDAASRARYDDGLTRGHLRYIEGEAAKAREAAKPKPKTLEELARTPKAKELARKADRLLGGGKVEEARVLLTDAVQDDFENTDLRSRLNELYTLGGYEALSDVREAAPVATAQPPSATPRAASVAPGVRKVMTLEELATTPKAKELAKRADRLLLAKKFEEARVVLTDAVQDDQENVELKARLDALYTAGGYEKL